MAMTRIGIDADVELFLERVEGEVERLRLAAVGLAQDRQFARRDFLRIGLASHLEGAVLEPSSMTMTRRFG